MNFNIFTNKSLLFFLGGVAVGVFGPKLLKSAKFKEACLKSVAKGIELKRSAGIFSEELQEKFADFLAEAQAVAAEAEAATAEAVEAPKPARKVTARKTTAAARKTATTRKTSSRKTTARKTTTRKASSRKPATTEEAGA